MRKSSRFLTRVYLVALGAFAVAYIYCEQQLQIPYPPSPAPTIVEIPRGAGGREVVRLLHDRNIIQNEYIALGYLIVSGTRTRLRAGEYMFDKSMTIPEVVNKLVNDSVYLHRFTVPEGLTISGVAERWEEQGFGRAEDFTKAAADSVSLIRDLDQESASLEGYLFPETYSFPSRTTARQAITTMVSHFRAVVTRLQQTNPPERWPLNLRQTVILASLIETEAAHDNERPIIGGVYLNRLTRHILLQCDPTVIYGLEQMNQYRGSLTLQDLRSESPYNTYLHPGLPPGPITNPGRSSLEAAVNPTPSDLLFFVRTSEGRHTFSDSLEAHNRAVSKYRLEKAQARRRVDREFEISNRRSSARK